MREYNYHYDIAIADALHRFGSIGRRRLKKLIESNEYLNKNISFDTFYYHIKKMLNGGYIYEKKDQWKPGQTLPLSLTPLTREQVKLDTLTMQYPEITQKRENKIARSYTKLKKRDQQRENTWGTRLRGKKIYYLIICIASFDTPSKSYRYPGISMTDILSARYDGHAFWYLRLENDRLMIEECLNLLLKWGVVIRNETPEKESRFELAKLEWREFIRSCLKLLDGAIMPRLHLTWSNLRPPTPAERIYYETCWGRRNADNHLRSVYDDWKGRDTSTVKKAKARYLLDCLSVNIYGLISKIEKKYHHLSIEYPSLYKSVFETIYPEFLKSEVEKLYKNNVISKSKNYPKLKIFSIDDTLAFRDHVDYNKKKI